MRPKAKMENNNCTRSTRELDAPYCKDCGGHDYTWQDIGYVACASAGERDVDLIEVRVCESCGGPIIEPGEDSVRYRLTKEGADHAA